MTHGHLADDRLLALCVPQSDPSLADEPGAAAAHAHLEACPSCEARRLALLHLLDEVSTAADASVDTAFPPDRLARQHARILQRIDGARPGRLLSFPAGPVREPAPRAAQRLPRWVAVASAAAGILIGLAVGHLAERLPASATAPAARQMAEAGPFVPAVLSDDEFLGQIELAVGSAAPAFLMPLDRLTPGASDAGR